MSKIRTSSDSDELKQNDIYNFKVKSEEPAEENNKRDLPETVGAIVLAAIIMFVFFFILWKVFQRKTQSLRNHIQKAALSSDEEANDFNYNENESNVKTYNAQVLTLPHTIPEQANVKSRHHQISDRSLKNSLNKVKEDEKRSNKNMNRRDRSFYLRHPNKDFDNILSSKESVDLIMSLKSERINIQKKTQETTKACLKAFKLLRDCSKLFLNIRQAAKTPTVRSIDPVTRQNLAEIRQRCRQQRLNGHRHIWRQYEKNEQRLKKEAYLTMHSWLNKFQLRPELRQAVEETCLLQSAHRHEEVCYYRQQATIRRTISELDNAKNKVQSIKRLVCEAISQFQIQSDEEPILEFDDLYSNAFKEFATPKHQMPIKNEPNITTVNNCKKCRNQICSCSPKRPRNDPRSLEGAHSVALRLATTKDSPSVAVDHPELTEHEVHKVLKQITCVKSVASMTKCGDDEWEVVVISTRPRIGVIRFGCRGRSYSIELLNDAT